MHAHCVPHAWIIMASYAVHGSGSIESLKRFHKALTYARKCYAEFKTATTLVW